MDECRVKEALGSGSSKDHLVEFSSLMGPHLPASSTSSTSAGSNIPNTLLSLSGSQNSHTGGLSQQMVLQQHLSQRQLAWQQFAQQQFTQQQFMQQQIAQQQLMMQLTQQLVQQQLVQPTFSQQFQAAVHATPMTFVPVNTGSPLFSPSTSHQYNSLDTNMRWSSPSPPPSEHILLSSHGHSKDSTGNDIASPKSAKTQGNVHYSLNTSSKLSSGAGSLGKQMPLTMQASSLSMNPSISTGELITGILSPLPAT